MEDPRKNSRHQDKKKMAIKIGGGGGINVGGVILLGGALAAATFLGSAFAIKTRRRRSNGNNCNNQQPPPPAPAVPINPPNELKNEVTKGITFILPDSSNGTSTMGVTQIESEPLVSTQILILDEKPKLESNADDKIVLSDIPKEPETSPLFDESSISKEESASPVFDNLLPVKPGDVKENESLQEIEVIVNLDEAIEAENAGQIAVEEDVPQWPILGIQEEEKECEGDGKIIAEKCEEGVEPANVEVKMLLNEEQESPTCGDQEIISSFVASEVKQQECSLAVFDNPTELEPEDVNKNEELERPLSTESDQVMGRNEELEAAYGDQLVIEDTPQMQSNEEQESPMGGDEEIICSDDSIPRISVCEVKQQDCLLAVFDSPTAFEPENMSTNDERPLSMESDQVMGRDEAANGDEIPIEASPQMQLTEELKEEEYGGDIVVQKCVVVFEAPHSAQIAVEDDQSASEKPTLESTPSENSANVQELCPTEPENIEQKDPTEEAVKVMKEDKAIESACADQIAEEDKSPMQLIEKEQKEDYSDRYIVVEEGEEAVEKVMSDMAEVDDNPQMQFSEEEEEGEDEDKEKEEIDDADDDEEEEIDDADDEEEIGDTDDEDTSEKAEESSEGTGDSSMNPMPTQFGQQSQCRNFR